MEHSCAPLLFSCRDYIAMLGFAEQFATGLCVFSIRTPRGATIRSRALRPDFCSSVTDRSLPIDSSSPAAMSTVMADGWPGSATSVLLALRWRHPGEGVFQFDAVKGIDGSEFVANVARAIAARHVRQGLRQR